MSAHGIPMPNPSPREARAASRPAPAAGEFLIRRARDRDAGHVVALLSQDHHLEVAFDPAQFFVGELEGRVVACARLKPLGADLWEIASVVVDGAFRGRGYGARLVHSALGGIRGTVYALALAPEFFATQGFRRIDAVPEPLLGKATSVCSSSGFVPMERHADGATGSR